MPDNFDAHYGDSLIFEVRNQAGLGISDPKCQSFKATWLALIFISICRLACNYVRLSAVIFYAGFTILFDLLQHRGALSLETIKLHDLGLQNLRSNSARMGDRGKLISAIAEQVVDLY